MTEKTGSKRGRRSLRGALYLDASALAKLYLPEPESEALETVLMRRRDLYVSDLSVTEIVSAAARRHRKGEMTQQDLTRLHKILLDDVTDRNYLTAALDSSVHRSAEKLLLAFSGSFLRAADALHLALAQSIEAKTFVTYDHRLIEAVEVAGMQVFP
jgi:predicted nucleic acid-binding protein